MAITALPTPPSRSDPANFADRGDAFLGALPTFQSEANALATDVTTKQGIASTAATTATTQAGIATTQAGIATTQVGLAEAQVDLAEAQVAIATTQAGNALTSANNAATSFDSFDDRYLGAKTSDPTLDNDGDALLTGALYFNSVAGEMRVYSGSAWLASYLPEASYVNLNGTQTLTNKTIDIANNTLTGVQPTLVSGTNIKTVGGQSVLGSGDLEVGGGGTAEFIATGTIPNGATVALRTDGTIEVVDGYAQSASTGLGTQYFAGTDAARMAVCSVGVNKIAIAFNDISNTNRTQIVIGTISGNIITFGAVQSITATNSSTRVGITYVPTTNHVIVALCNTQGRCFAGTISGTTVSFGSEAQFTTSTNAQALFYNETVGKAYVVFQNAPSTRTECRVINLSGNSISYGTSAIVSNFDPEQTLGVAFDNDNQVLYIAGRAADFSSHAFVAAASITSTSASLISETTFTTFGVGTDSVSVAYNNLIGKAFVCCSSNTGNGLRIGVVTLNGSTLSVASTDFNGLTSAGIRAWIAFDDFIKKVVVAYGNESGLFYATVNLNNSILSLQDKISLPISTLSAPVLYLANEPLGGANIIVYTGSTTNGTAFSVRLSGSNTNVDKFIGIANENIATGNSGNIAIISGTNASQSGLTVGANYWLNPDGSFSETITPYGHLGLAISATELLITDTRTILSPLAIDAVGTPSNTTFLRGDGSWSEAGAWVLLESASASASSTVDFTNIDASFDSYAVICDNLTTNGINSGITLQLFISGTVITSNTYDFHGSQAASNSSTWSSNRASGAGAIIMLPVVNTAGAFLLNLIGSKSPTAKTVNWHGGGHFTSTTPVISTNVGSGALRSTGIVTGFRFGVNTGGALINTGNFYLYGIRN